MRRRWFASLTILMATAGHAQDHPTSCCGIVSMTVYSNGSVVGHYQRPAGDLFGRIGADGSVEGFWVQQRGFKTCPAAYRGSHHWGRFAFQSIGDAQITGTWGDCDADPVWPWGFQNDPHPHDAPVF